MAGRTRLPSTRRGSHCSRTSAPDLRRRVVTATGSSIDERVRGRSGHPSLCVAAIAMTDAADATGAATGAIPGLTR